MENEKDFNFDESGLIYGAVNLIMELDKNDPEFKKKMRAIVKRLVHHQKLDVYGKVAWWLRTFDQQFVMDRISEKMATHEEWSKMNDDDVWTSGG